MATFNKTRKGWRVRVRVKGMPCASATLPTRQLAERWAHKTEVDLIEGKYFGVSYTMTLGELINQYLDREAPLRLKAGSIPTVISGLKVWQTSIGDVLLAHLRTHHILEVRDALLTDHKASTVNRIVANLSSVFTYAVEREYMSANPCQRIRPLSTKRRQAHVLTSTEQQALLTALEGTPLHSTVSFALSTGARLSEITSLRSEDIDTQRQTVTFRDTKNGTNRTIPISADMPVRVPFVFTYYEWRKALVKADLTSLCFHDLRHTFVTRAVSQGHDLLKIAAFTGHSSTAMVQYYTHLAPDDLRPLTGSVELQK